ncbi:hypothetical protein BLX24_00510 [Arsenicibacter rosenii]|uniref:Nicotinate-nucleotide--dimethylbenzimidazole phosphoribosyltransferase n=1 Tax=Arsenicibacter rosenii TaxID=1750698 RepID=A0A1S2VR39_9BACT|nr:hypothetical protein BLX24_00510 [Arsenicibacter rosenii]
MAWVHQQLKNRKGQAGWIDELVSALTDLTRQKELMAGPVANAHVLVFAGDHGWKQETDPTTSYRLIQQLIGDDNHVFDQYRRNGLTLLLCDVGVQGTFAENTPVFVKFKVRPATNDIREAAAMELFECEAAMDAGRTLVNGVAYRDCNTVGFGTLGAGSGLPAGLLIHQLTGIPLAACLPEEITPAEAEAILSRAEAGTADELLAQTGGLEIAAVAGGLLQAAENEMHVLLTGNTCIVAAFLLACATNPAVAERYLL